MDKLALFYKEVCITQDNPSSVMKSKNRAMCPKYGKLFTNKKGVKQHILRMHVQEAKLNESKTETITLEESPDIIPHPPTSVTRTQPMDVVTVQTVPKEVNNPILERENEGVENSKEADKEFIRLIANELVDECNLEDYNFQCGECGQIFAEEKETEMHVSNHHCSLCDKFERENKMLKLESVNKEKVNAAQTDKLDKVIKKNESLAKENRRLNLALKESITAMNEAKKEGELQRESMNDILKQNNLLNEEVRVKADYITLIEETRKNQRENQSKQENENKDDEEIEIVIEKETTTQATKSYADIINNGKNKHKCNECNY